MPKLTITGKELGCSELPSIVETHDGFTGYNSRNDVLKRHIDARVSGHVDNRLGDVNAKVRAGNYMEGTIGQMVLDKLNQIGKVTTSLPTEADRNPLVPGLGSSPDYYVTIQDSIEFKDNFQVSHTLTGKGLLEIKNSTIPGLPTNVRIQSQGQMLCGNYSWCIIARLVSGWDLQLYVEFSNRDVQDKITEAVTDFWHRVDTEDYYDPDSSSEASRLIKGNGITDPIDLSGNNELPTLIHEWKANEKIMKHSKQIKDDLEIHMKSILGQNEVGKCQNYELRHTTVNYKPQPEKLVPAKEGYSTRRFGIKELNE